MPRKSRTKPHSTNILDYHSNLSMQEKEHLVAEAILKAEQTKKPLEKVSGPKGELPPTVRR
jgi:hypothetical protein